MQGLVLIIVPGVMSVVLAFALTVWAVWPKSRLPEWAMLSLPVPWLVSALLLQLSLGWVVIPTAVMAGLALLACLGVRGERRRLSGGATQERDVRRFRLAVLAVAALFMLVGCGIFWSLA